MRQRSPTLEGFRAMFRRPTLGLAEIAWRWSFGVAAGLLLTLSFLEYLDTLPVTAGEMLFLRSRQPVLISQAILHIFRGSAPRLVGAMIVLGAALALAWIVASALGRAATVKALLSYFREGDRPEAACPRMGSLMGLNFFRVAVTLAATVGCVAALLLGGAASPTGDPSPGSAFLIFLTVTMLVGLAWIVVNWFLSLASVFVIGEGRDTFGAMAAAVDLCRARTGPVFAAGTWFGLAHLAAFFAASSVVAFPLAFAGVLPAGVVLGGVLLVTVLYFAVVDFLYVGRLAAYVAIVEWPESSQPSALGIQPGGSAPPSALSPQSDDDILCDVPGIAAPTGGRRSGATSLRSRMEPKL